MMHIQAVDYVYLEAAVPEVPREREESKGLGPEVIGRKIVNPWIDKDQGRSHDRKKSSKIMVINN